MEDRVRHELAAALQRFGDGNLIALGMVVHVDARRFFSHRTGKNPQDLLDIFRENQFVEGNSDVAGIDVAEIHPYFQGEFLNTAHALFFRGRYGDLQGIEVIAVGLGESQFS